MIQSKIGAAFWGVLLSVILSGPKASAETYDRVLLISSYHPGFPTFFRQIEGIQSVFEVGSIVLDIEFMDSKRFYDETNLEHFRESLSYKLANTPNYHLIMTADDNALTFVIEHQADLFAGLPIIFFGVNNIDLAQAQNANPQITGVVESVSMLETLQVIRKLDPETRNITALVDSSPSGQGDLKTFYHLRDEMEGVDLSDISLRDLSFDEFAARLRNLSDHTAVLLLSAYRDKSGQSLLFHDSLVLIRDNLSRPLYHLWYHGMGDGVLGGKLVNHFDQGASAAHMALEVLRGHPVERMTVQMESPNPYIFDWRELKRFGIEMATLPEESTVLYEPFSFYKTYKVFIWTVVAVFVILLLFVFFLAVNIVLRRKAEQALRESESLYRTLVEHIDLGITLLDRDCKIVKINRKHADMHQKPVDYFHGKYCFREFEKREQPCSHCPGRVAMATGEPAETITQGIRDDGSSFDARVMAFPLFDGAEPSGFIELVEDITERKKAEEALRENEALFRSQFELGNIGMAITSPDKGWLRVNQRLCDMIGYSADEMQQRTWVEMTHPDDLAPEVSLFNRLIADEIDVYEMDKRFIRKDGDILWTHLTVSCFRNSDRSVQFLISAINDLTERIRMEETIKQTQKMEAIGTLAGGIAHDFNNILSAILGYTELALDTIPKDGLLKKYLSAVLSSALRARDLVKQILTFSRKGAEERQPVLLSTIAKEVAKLLRATLPSTIEIRQNIPEDNGIVIANPTQMHQIVMNICTNAGHAMQDNGGVLVISLKPVVITTENVSSWQNISPGPFVELTISDTGTGIDPKIIHRIFEPFFTTKEKEKGTGMGLAVVHGIVKDHGGDIRVDSQPGKGTTFTILLPRETADSVLKEDATSRMPTGSEHILFVDDEQALVDLGKNMLESLGYTVTTCSGSIEALEKFQHMLEAIDLVITDQTMPHMTGYDLTKRLLAIKPDLPVILCTGYSDKITQKKAEDASIRGLMYKPFSRNEMAFKIREILETKDSVARSSLSRPSSVPTQR